ncbi:Talin-2, partial [Bienertia sinuspersici]
MRGTRTKEKSLELDYPHQAILECIKIVNSLRDCHKTRETWVNLQQTQEPQIISLGTLITFAITCRKNWLRRNQWVFKKSHEPLERLMKGINWMCMEFWYSRPQKPLSVNAQPLHENTSVLITDASFIENSLVAGITGIKLKDNYQWEQGMVKKIRCLDATSAELIAILNALKWARINGWENFTIITDSATASQGIRNTTSIADKYINMYINCRELLELCKANIIKGSREETKRADVVAKWGRETQLEPGGKQ